MLRLALAYWPGGMSLRSSAARATGCNIAHLSGVGLLKRLKGANHWLSYIAAALLNDGCRARHAKRRLRIVDGSVIRSSGKGGTDWRPHATYDPAEGRFSQLEITDTQSGESLSPARPSAHLSLWRMQRFLRNALLVAILGELRLSRIDQSPAGAVGTLFEPPPTKDIAVQ